MANLTKKQKEILGKIKLLIGVDLLEKAYFLRREVIGLDVYFDSHAADAIKRQIERVGYQYKLYDVSLNGHQRIALRLK